MATYSSLRSSSISRFELADIGLGNIFSSNPTIKTVGNSSPFAAWTVISVTFGELSSALSASE